MQAHLGAHLTRSFASRLDSGSSNRKTCGIAHDGAAHGDALALAAGKLARHAVEQRVESEDARGLAHPLRRSRLWATPRISQREAHVLGDRHVRIERVGLEDHGDVALLRRHVVDHAAVDRISPPVMLSRPAIMRSSVDFPQPDGPTSTTNSPSFTESETSCMTSTAP